MSAREIIIYSIVHKITSYNSDNACELCRYYEENQCYLLNIFFLNYVSLCATVFIYKSNR